MLQAIIHTVQLRSYELYTRPYELNIVGIRSDNTTPNKFDDEIHVFFKNNVSQWIHYPFQATTDPGTFWLKNPLSPQGTAILKAGQYRQAYQIGLHRGKYYAMVQRKPVTVIRDYDRNAVLDFYNGKAFIGLYGINIHRATASGTSKTIDKYSAGCQVLANSNDFNRLMQLCEQHKKLYGNSFTYTLLDKRAIVRQQRKAAVLSISGLAIGLGLAFLTYQIVK